MCVCKCCVEKEAKMVEKGGHFGGKMVLSDLTYFFVSSRGRVYQPN